MNAHLRISPSGLREGCDWFAQNMSREMHVRIDAVCVCMCVCVNRHITHSLVCELERIFIHTYSHSHVCV